MERISYGQRRLEVDPEERQSPARTVEPVEEEKKENKKEEEEEEEEQEKPSCLMDIYWSPSVIQR